MQVKLTYFKNSGKYYSCGEYNTECKNMFEIFDEVREKAIYRRLPGLMENHSPFHVLIDVPEHPENYPGLVPIHTIL